MSLYRAIIARFSSPADAADDVFARRLSKLARPLPVTQPKQRLFVRSLA